MARTKGAKGKYTLAVKEQVESAFRKVNGPANKGLIDLAESHPAIFYGLVSKLIPQQASIDITTVVVDLNLAFDQANERIKQLESERRDMITIDQTNSLAGDKALITKEESG